LNDANVSGNLQRLDAYAPLKSPVEKVTPLCNGEGRGERGLLNATLKYPKEPEANVYRPKCTFLSDKHVYNGEKISGISVGMTRGTQAGPSR
jgi:hypothetical protein